MRRNGGGSFCLGGGVRVTVLLMKRYRRSGPWMTALARLHALRMTDQETADVLADLSDAAIRALESACPGGRWTYEAIGDVLAPEAAESGPWCRRMVRYWRGQLGLDAWPRQEERSFSLDSRRRKTLLKYATAQGWGHLTGRALELAALLARQTPYEEIGRQLHWPAAAVAAWVQNPWDMLRRTEVDLLSLLAGWGGRMTRADLGLARTGHTDGETWLSLLRRKALVERVGRSGPTPAYRLSAGVGRLAEDFTPTRVEREFETLGVGARKRSRSVGTQLQYTS